MAENLHSSQSFSAAVVSYLISSSQQMNRKKGEKITDLVTQELRTLVKAGAAQENLSQPITEEERQHALRDFEGRNKRRM